ncbi:MAG: hypothetical protein ABIL03_01925, partial [candidate division WOR-3 bacterium]
MSILICLLRAQFVMGTILEIEVYGEDAEAFADTVFSLANEMDKLWRGFWEGWVLPPSPSRWAAPCHRRWPAGTMPVTSAGVSS